MKILKRPNGSRYWCAPLDNIGFCLLEVSLDGEVYKYGIPSTTECCKAERVGNKWKIRKYDFSGNPIECVIRTDVLVGFAWYNIDEKLWENSIYADTIRRCKEFFSISNLDKAKTIYKTSNGFSYYVTKEGEVWNTETMTKVNGGVYNNDYRYVKLGSVDHIAMHRLVAHHFVPKPKDLVDQGLKEDDLVVNHLDGNKLNNRWDNLEWTTNAGNMAHASATGLLPTTIDDHVLEHIFKHLEEGWSNIAISKETGISANTINGIRRRVSPRYRTDKYTWHKYSVDVHEKERRDELAMKCVEMFNQGMSYQAIADKLGFISKSSVARLITTHRDLITRKLPRKPAKRGELDKATIFSIYDEFYTDKKNCEIARKYNVSHLLIYYLRTGHLHSDLAREYITSKGLSRYWQGFRHTK